MCTITGQRANEQLNERAYVRVRAIVKAKLTILQNNLGNRLKIAFRGLRKISYLFEEYWQFVAMQTLKNASSLMNSYRCSTSLYTAIDKPNTNYRLSYAIN